MTRPGLAALAFLVLLAGCNAPASGTQTPTFTPVSVPEPGENDRLAPGELAPGVDASGVTDAERLALAHGAVLGNTSYTVTQRIRQTDEDGSLESQYVTCGRFAAAPGRFRVVLSQTDRVDGNLSTRRVERFADGARVYAAVTADNVTRYRVVRDPTGAPRAPGTLYPTNLTNRPAIDRLFSLVDTTITERWVENGTRYVRLESREPPGAVALPPLRNVSLEATVATSGLITSYRVEYDVVRDGSTVHVVVAVEYSDVGETTVRPPAWVDQATATGERRRLPVEQLD